MQHVHQGILVNHLKSVFPGEELCENTRKKSQIKAHPSSSHYLELDVWLPNLNLCFEFQDEYHFVQVWYKHSPLSQTFTADSNKRYLALHKGLQLITVPCWWDGSRESLTSTIAFECPDFGLPKDTPIPLNPTLDFFQEPKIKGVGELMLASFPMDTEIIKLHTWWLGEKYDGVRCCWNPQQRKLYSRVGNELTLPPLMVASLPQSFIDCEIWAGRGHFSHTISFVKSSIKSVYWDLFRLMAFDNPSIKNQADPFEERYATLIRSLPANHPFVLIAPRLLCKKGSTNKINLLEKIILESEGEGVILRRKGSLYEPGRSLSLLKLKENTDEYEGIVIEIQDHAIVVELPNRAIFTVPNENVKVDPSVGDIVTFAYDMSTHKTLSIPTNIKVFKIRYDLTWKDVMKQYVHESGQKNAHMNIKSAGDLNSILLPENHNIRQYRGEQDWSKPEIRRQFFEKYALENKFDPLIAENWYAQVRSKIMALKGADSIMNYHGNIPKAISDLFPEIGIKRDLWTKSPWKDIKLRRKFFEDYARENNFNYLKAEHWYSHSKKKLLAYPGVETVIKYHGNDIAKAVRDLFPEMKFNPALWTYASAWKDPRNRRKFFEQYAADHKFDPLQFRNWALHPRAQLLAAKGTSRILKYHKNSLVRALRDLFPEFDSQQS